jgi:hypothetical protein
MAAFTTSSGEELKLEDTNLAGIGSEADVAQRKAAAATDSNWDGVAEQNGIEIWRVENRRTEADTPDFGIARWPVEDYGNFYAGDSYIILRTKISDDGEKEMDVHFWLGENTTQDEMGVAAYKTVELDDLLDGEPVQHREVMGYESKRFLSYFPFVKYMDGGIESGFRKVKPEEYQPRLLHVRKEGKCTIVKQVPLSIDSLHHGDAFILDAGSVIYTWFGDNCSAFEKSKAGTVRFNLIQERHGKSCAGDDDADHFWELLGGRGEVSNEDRPPEDPIDYDARVMFRLSDASGTLERTEVQRGHLDRENLDSNDVFILDIVSEIFVWVGSNASRDERRNAMKVATAYMIEAGRPPHTGITRVVEGAREPINFSDVFQSRRGSLY